MKLNAIAVAIGLLAGCADMNINKESTGTAVGAIAGAVVGKQAGGTKGAIVGAIVGGVIGNRIGAYLDAEDRKKLAALEQRALTTGTGGSFVSTKSKATVTVAAAPPTLEKPRDYAMSGTVKAQPIVLIDPITIRAYVDTPVYNATNENDKPKLVIQQGVPMRISAKVANENWSVVGDEHVGLGYVPRRYLEASVVSEAKPAEAPIAEAKAVPKKGTAVAKAPTQVNPKVAGKTPSSTAPAAMTKEQYEAEMDALHAAYKPRSNEGSGAAMPNPTVKMPAQYNVTVVQASTECKVVSRKVTPPGGAEPFSENIKYCNEPPNGWQTQAVG